MVVMRRRNSVYCEIVIYFSHFYSISLSTPQALGQPVENKGSSLLTTLTKFSTSYCQKIEGTSRDIETHQLSGGARICYIFHNTFSEALNAIQPLEGLNRTDILHAISNAMGPRPALFVSEMAFELLVKRQIRLMLQPSLQCVDLVYEELQRIIQYCLSSVRDFQRFPTLRERMNSVVMSLIRRRLPITNQMVENLISIELAYINTNHPDFVDGTRAAYELYMLSQTQKKQASLQRQQNDKTSSQKSEATSTTTASASAPAISAQTDKHQKQGSSWLTSISPLFGGAKVSVQTSKSTSSSGGGASGASSSAGNISGLNSFTTASEGGESDWTLDSGATTNPSTRMVNRQQFDCELIEKLITSYFLIVRKSIQDSIPKAVMHCLVNYVKEELQSELVSELYRTESYDELMEEAPEMIARRREVSEMVKALQKASDILNEIRDLQFEAKIVGFSDFEQ